MTFLAIVNGSLARAPCSLGGL